MATLELVNVRKNYGKVEAVKGVNLKCNDGEFVALLGPSGCGKSTTMRMIAGLEDITSGEIYIGGRLVNDLGPKERDIAMVFENYALYPHRTVYENMAFPLIMRKYSPSEIKKKVYEAAELLNITDILNQYPSSLSDGQKQRVGIGRAIVRRPSLFLFDEPISHLDAILRQQMRKEIRRLQKSLNATMLYVTHDQLEALSMADRIVVMNEGLFQQIGTREEILENPSNTFVARFVGEPPMNFLRAKFTRREGQLAVTFDKLSVEGNPAVMELKEERSQKAAELAGNNDITVGIRPMHVKLFNTPQEDAFLGHVYFIEMLDEYNIITVKISNERLLVEAPKSFKTNIDSPVWAQFQERKMHFFDASSGKNLLAVD